MKRFFAGLLIAVSTFVTGIAIEQLLQFQAKFSVEPKYEAVSENPTSLEHSSIPIIEQPKKELIVKELIEIDVFPDPSGYFSPIKTNGLNRELYLSLWISKESNSKKIDGGVHTNSMYYAPKIIEINNKKFNMKTKKVDEVEYEFKGVFIKNGFEKEFLDGEKVLKGSLIKFKNGKKIVQVKTTFTYFTGC